MDIAISRLTPPNGYIKDTIVTAFNFCNIQ